MAETGKNKDKTKEEDSFPKRTEYSSDLDFQMKPSTLQKLAEKFNQFCTFAYAMYLVNTILILRK